MDIFLSSNNNVSNDTKIIFCLLRKQSHYNNYNTYYITILVFCPFVMIIITVFHMLTNCIPLKIVDISCKKYCIQGQKREAIPAVIILLYDVYSFVNTGLGMRNIIYT